MNYFVTIYNHDKKYKKNKENNTNKHDQFALNYLTFVILTFVKKILTFSAVLPGFVEKLQSPNK